MPSTETATATPATTSTTETAAEKIADLKSAAKEAMVEKRVLPKRSTRSSNRSSNRSSSKTSRSSRASNSSVEMASASDSAADSADESVLSRASSVAVEGPVESHYLWGCELSRSNDCFVLPFPGEEEYCDDELHMLMIKSATLGVNAIEGDRNVIEIRYHDHDDKEARNVIASLTLGKLEFCRLDLRVSHLAGREVSLKLIKGSGPVSILGNHLVESYGPHPEDESEVETEDEDYAPDASSAESGTEASGMETDGDEVDADEVKDLNEDTKKAEESK